MCLRERAVGGTSGSVKNPEMRHPDRTLVLRSPADFAFDDPGAMGEKTARAPAGGISLEGVKERLAVDEPRCVIRIELLPIPGNFFLHVC